MTGTNTLAYYWPTATNEEKSVTFLINFFSTQCLKWRHDTQHNDTQHNDTQHNDTQHNDTQHNDTQHNDTQHNDTQHNENANVTLDRKVIASSVTRKLIKILPNIWKKCPKSAKISTCKLNLKAKNINIKPNLKS